MQRKVFIFLPESTTLSSTFVTTKEVSLLLPESGQMSMYTLVTPFVTPPRASLLIHQQPVSASHPQHHHHMVSLSMTGNFPFAQVLPCVPLPRASLQSLASTHPLQPPPHLPPSQMAMDSGLHLLHFNTSWPTSNPTVHGLNNYHQQHLLMVSVSLQL